VQCSGDAVYVPNDQWICLENDLFSGCGSVIEGQFLNLEAENITADSIGAFAGNLHGFSGPWGGPSYGGTIINSILTGLGVDDQSANDFSQVSTVVAGSGSGIYINPGVGDGNYYLRPGTYQNAGTTAIDGSLLADLQTKTTCPPTVYANTAISGNTTLGMAVPRDACNPGPDLGYHYAPLDYVFGGVTVSGSLTFMADCAVGWFNAGQGYGILLGSGATANFQGTANMPVWWVRGNTVQEEGGSTAWPGAGAAGGLVGQGGSGWPQANLFFTHCSILGSGDGGFLNHFADGGYLTVNAAHSEFYGGMIGGYALSCYFTNCLMDRMGGGQFEGYPGNAFIVQNCTWHGGWLSLTPSAAISLVVRDSSFDGTCLSISNYARSGYANYDYNAFSDASEEFPLSGNHNVVVSGGFNWQSSSFGNYYLPGGSPLIAAGDVTANLVGLYYFTTQTSQAPEGDAQVDIGYHYVAADGYGNPLADGTGQPYYLDAGNGNIVEESGEMSGAIPPIQFTIAVPNQYVNNASVPLQLTIQSGVPYYCTVMLDSINFAGASWTPYTSSTISANLGTAQGWHTVWVGLCGQPSGPAGGGLQSWSAIRLNLDSTGPVLVVTNAANVTIPMLQLGGYANEQLASLTYDLANANGTITGQPGYMTGAIFDTNSLVCTNNSFECLDLVLASGANTVTLHATDLAGNVTASGFTFNLDYSGKPAPVIQLWWPQDGTQIAGSSFTCRGTVDDPTVALSAQITDSNDDINVVPGVIERNGNFWVDNIPLAPGNNSLTLTATDINNHTTTTTITVVQSSVQLTINPITDDLYQPTVTVTGTINTNNYTVWVNGVAASQSGTAPSISWTAWNVPMNGDGCAVVQARAIPNTPADSYGNGDGNGGGGTSSSLSNPGNPSAPDALDLELTPYKPAKVYCPYFFQSWSAQSETFYVPGNNLSEVDSYTETVQWWCQTGGSSGDDACATQFSPSGSIDNINNVFYQNHWDTNDNEIILFACPTNAGPVTNLVPLPPSAQPPPFVTATALPGVNGMITFVGNTAPWGNCFQTSSLSAFTPFNVKTGGRGLPGRQCLHAVAANAVAIVQPFYESAFDGLYSNLLTTSAIPPQQVTIMGQLEGTDGNVWTNLPDGEDMSLPITASAVPCFYAAPAAPRYPLHIFFNGSDVTDSNTTVIVGQEINLTCSFVGAGAPACQNASWTVPSTAESQFYVSSDLLWTNGYPIALPPAMLTNTTNVSFFWADGSFNGLTKTVTCSALARGVSNFASTTFRVVRPNISATNISYQTGSVMITNSYGFLAILFGDRGDETNHGIQMAYDSNFSSTVPTGIPGVNGFELNWVQVISRCTCDLFIANATNGDTDYTKDTNVPLLDTVYPYNQPTDPQNPITDNPFVALSHYLQTGGAKVTDYETWLMFRPGAAVGASETNNWVPLWIISWNLGAYAEGEGDSASDWSFVLSPWISVSNSLDSGTRYPTWTNNITNIPFCPPLPDY
jgi:hypothetical protein